MKKLFATWLLSYFRFLAQLQLKKVHPTVIGVTGSAGKSSTMEAVAAILSEKHTIKVGRKANSESGIPLNILGLSPHDFSLLDWLRLVVLAPLALLTNSETYEYYIVEMGIDSPFPPKNMEYLLSILQPDIGIFTSVGAVHSEPFDCLVQGKTPEERHDSLVELIAREKGKMITSLSPEGVAILNADQAALLRGATPTSAKIMTFSKHQDATVQLAQMDWDADGTRMVFCVGDDKVSLHYSGYLLPEHFAGTFAAAICVGLHLGYSAYLSCKLLEKNFKLPPGRATIIPAINHATIIDSTYNSSSRPLIDLLHLLTHIRAGRRLALLGDMRELGTLAQIEHEKVAQVASTILHEVVLVGPLMREFALPIFHQHHIPAHWFASASEAAEYLKTTLHVDDVLLVKGSQNTLLLEIAVEQLMAHKEDADDLLCRRSEYWDNERRKLLPAAQP